MAEDNQPLIEKVKAALEESSGVKWFPTDDGQSLSTPISLGTAGYYDSMEFKDRNDPEKRFKLPDGSILEFESSMGQTKAKLDFFEGLHDTCKSTKTPELSYMGDSLSALGEVGKKSGYHLISINIRGSANADTEARILKAAETYGKYIAPFASNYQEALKKSEVPDDIVDNLILQVTGTDRPR